jgi:hypothetical protein
MICRWTDPSLRARALAGGQFVDTLTIADGRVAAPRKAAPQRTVLLGAGGRRLAAAALVDAVDDGGDDPDVAG